jgi:hypothetical protein
MFNSTFKNLILVVSLFVTSLSVASALPFTTPPPNLYDLQGNGLHISYSTTGFDGKPHFSYQNGAQVLNFSGDQIRTVGTEVGTLVSVTTLMTIDSGSTTFTVLIPRVNLDSTLQAAVKTEGITTKHKFSLIPDLMRGQLDTYKFTLLSGTASFVNF